jgi:hypothetical protein
MSARPFLTPKLPPFDHLVGAQERRRRHLDAERLRGFEVDGSCWLCCVRSEGRPA